MTVTTIIKGQIVEYRNGQWVHFDSLAPVLPLAEKDYKCEECGRQYRTDLIIPDVIWERICSSEVGLICGSCIMRRIEDLHEFELLVVSEVADAAEEMAGGIE